MDHRSLKSLDDVRKYATLILSLADRPGWRFDDADLTTQLAVERSFEIIGIELIRLEPRNPSITAQITKFRSIVGFRNRIAHGYEDDLNGAVFDEVINDHLPILKDEVARLSDRLS